MHSSCFRSCFSLYVMRRALISAFQTAALHGEVASNELFSARALSTTSARYASSVNPSVTTGTSTSNSRPITATLFPGDGEWDRVSTADERAIGENIWVELGWVQSRLLLCLRTCIHGCLCVCVCVQRRFASLHLHLSRIDLCVCRL